MSDCMPCAVKKSCRTFARRSSAARTTTEKFSFKYSFTSSAAASAFPA